MAYDLQLRGVCDHRVHRETQVVEREFLGEVDPINMNLSEIVAIPRGEFNTIRLDRPIASASTSNIHVYLDGEYEAPKDHPIMGWDLAPDELSVEPGKKTKIVLRNPRNAGGERKRFDPLTSSTFIAEEVPENDGGLITSSI